jgi:cell wall-associated NlpC family hydrolase
VHERTSHRRRRKTGTGSIALSLGLCLCAGQLVATAPASAAPVGVTVAAAAATVTPTIKTTYSRRSVGWGSTVKVTTKLVDPKTGKAVTGKVRLQLRTKSSNAWRTYRTKSTSSGGLVNFWSKPPVSVYFRTVFVGANGFESVASPSTWITVKASGAKVLAEARKHKGARYLFGGAGPKRFDCSGYTRYVYRKAAGKKLPHKANKQQKYGKPVSKSNKKAGDLLVFRSGSYGTHVGIYAGGGYMWASPHAGKTVQKQKVYSKNYVVRRLVSA